MTVSTGQARSPASSVVTPGSARRCRARPSGPARPCSAPTTHISAQVIDDRSGRTLAAASTCERDRARHGRHRATRPPPPRGRLASSAERAKAAGVTKVVFDRGGNLYHGRVAAVADAAASQDWSSA